MDTIDFVVMWVDSTDVEWQKKKSFYSGKPFFEKEEKQYRDWDTFKFWFRSVERYAPWVRKIHLVTEGHIPPWLDVNHEKINHVRHKDIMPEDSLPTFNASAIEININKIKGLSERFVFFNDDMFINNPVKPEDFFLNDKPCDFAILNAQAYGGVSLGEIGTMISNSTGMINRKFNKNEVIKGNIFKWINYKYGKEILRTLLLLSWSNFTGFKDHHGPQPFLKSTFLEVWSEFSDILNETTSSKFRQDSNVTQYLFRYWFLSQGEFKPRRNNNVFLQMDDNSIYELSKFLYGHSLFVCLNDGNVSDFSLVYSELNKLLEAKFSGKSKYEKD